jgi:signal transduction histidine kinase
LIAVQDALIATVVHDLKNALGVLVQELDSLQRAAAGGPLASGVGTAHGIANELSARLIAFLTLHRAQSAGLVAANRDHNPDDFLNEVLAGLVLPQSAPTVMVEPTHDAPAFWFFDAYLIRLALEAAIQNAARFARSQIQLRARAHDDWLVLSVEDDGPGLGTEGAPSTGLGTELCRSIAAAHINAGRKGKVVLQNRSEGGACFELWLP